MTIGRRARSIEWDARTSGGSRYVADVVLPGTLVARVLRSPHPHARILSLARRRPRGCLASPRCSPPGTCPIGCTSTKAGASRIAGRSRATSCGSSARRSPSSRPRRPAQADDRARAIRVRYEALPAVTTVAAALADGAPRLHARAVGDQRLARDRARLRRHRGRPPRRPRHGTGRYRFGRQAHARMEPNGTLARWDPETGPARAVDVHPVAVLRARGGRPDPGSRHGPGDLREVAVGGGFGSKSKIADQEVLAGALAVRTGRPVRLVLSRAEEFATTKCRHAFDVELTTGIDGDGRLTHRETRILVDNGAYNHSGASVTGRRCRRGLVVPDGWRGARPCDASSTRTSTPGASSAGTGSRRSPSRSSRRWTSWPTRAGSTRSSSGF